ncbi:MAG: glutamine amidotransferase [Rhodomicrobiaceae bacterium]|jgi:glutamate synthase domain-containing protein 1
MCGIAGLFIKDKNLEPQLGALLSEMTSTLCGRGPDSAGFALYSHPDAGKVKLSVRGEDGIDLNELGAELSKELGQDVGVTIRHTHAVFSVPESSVSKAISWIDENPEKVSLVGQGQRLEIYKEVGYPTDVANEFGISKIAGTHGISHTRMATESRVSADGAHPFSTGSDQCLVHNGSLSNHASLRRTLRDNGIVIRTNNDSEVAAGYISRELRDGSSLGSALENSLDDLDGFFTFVVGTENGFGVLRDPIACKPAVMAETDQYIAFASEYKSLTCLPGIEDARIWEPTPAHSYFWEH